MRNVLILMYMIVLHPILFAKFSIRDKSKFFLANGRKQNIKTKNLYLGRNVRFGEYTRINFYEKGILKIGNRCYFGQRNTFLVGGDIILGDEVLMASDICITSENHGIDPVLNLNYGLQPLITAPVIIEDGCWIGEKAIILPGVHIGKKSIIGAGSVVTKDIPDFSIAAGNPARVLKKYDFDKKIWVKVT